MKQPLSVLQTVSFIHTGSVTACGWLRASKAAPQVDGTGGSMASTSPSSMRPEFLSPAPMLKFGVLIYAPATPALWDIESRWLSLTGCQRRSRFSRSLCHGNKVQSEQTGHKTTPASSSWMITGAHPVYMWAYIIPSVYIYNNNIT